MNTLADIPLHENERQAIEAATHLLHEAFPIEQVILFGSKARAAGDDESDIDLLVLTSRKLHWREEEAMTNTLFDVEMAHNVLISPLIVPADEWFHGVYQVLAIHDEIERDGVAA